jgi:hypothetical protein
VDIAALLAKCDVVGDRRDELLELAERAFEPSWWLEYGLNLPMRLTTLSDHEDAAIAIIGFETGLIPGLLQTKSYMTALMESLPIIPKGEIEERVELRMMRQDIHDHSKPPKCRFFLDEQTVTRTGAGREIMSEQVHHLLRMAVRPNIEIRVVPDAVGFHGGRLPFHLMEFAELNPVVYLENLNSAAFLEQKDTVAGYRSIVADLERVALDEGQSRAWLASVATALGQPREEHDEHAEPGEPDVAEKFFLG